MLSEEWLDVIPHLRCSSTPISQKRLICRISQCEQCRSEYRPKRQAPEVKRLRLEALGSAMGLCSSVCVRAYGAQQKRSESSGYPPTHVPTPVFTVIRR